MTEQRLLCESEHCRPKQHGGPRRAMFGSALCETCEDYTWSDLRDISELWPETVHGLTAPAARAGNEFVKGTRNPGLSLSEYAMQARRDAANTLGYWAHVLVDERETLTAPPLSDVAAVARFLSANLRHLTRNADHGTALSVRTDAREVRRTLFRTAYPTGARRFPDTRKGDRPIPCIEHATDDQGARVPCPGEYHTWITDRQEGFPDLVCTVDDEHVMQPSGFRRLRRRFDSAATKALVAAIATNNPSHYNSGSERMEA